MKKFKFEIQALQRITVEAETVEEARQLLISGDDVDSIIYSGCVRFGIDPSVSDGEEVKKL